MSFLPPFSLARKLTLSSLSDFWLLKEQMYPINDTTSRLPLKVTFNPTAHWKWQIMASLDDSMTKSAQASGGSGSELDEVKRMLTETNPILLATTILVSILHMLCVLVLSRRPRSWHSKRLGDECSAPFIRRSLSA